MARRTTVNVFDDFDGSPGAGPVRFGLDGNWYSVDLTPEHEAEFRALMRKYLDAAVTHAAKKSTSEKGTGEYNAHDVRKWLWSQNISVGERGRIPRAYLEMYAKREQ